jgi:hypothetical protein
VLIKITSYKNHKDRWTWGGLFIGGSLHEAKMSSEYRHIFLNYKKILFLEDNGCPIQIVTARKQLENMNYFNYFGGTINDARCTCEIKPRSIFFTSKLNLNLRKNLVKRYIWSITLHGRPSETWALRQIDQKYFGSFEMWCWRRMEKIIWTYRVRNEVVCYYMESTRRGISYVQ